MTYKQLVYYIIDKKLARLGYVFKKIFLPKRFNYNYAVNKLGFLKRKHPRDDGKIVYRSGKTMQAVLTATYEARKGKLNFKAQVPNYIKYTAFRLKKKDYFLEAILKRIGNIPNDFKLFYKLIIKNFPELKQSIRYLRKIYKILKFYQKERYFYRPFSIYHELKIIKRFEVNYILKSKRGLLKIQ